MKIGLIDVDGHNFPNIALMKLSAYHKKQGDSVEWYDSLFSDDMDIVYMSKVFSFTDDYIYPIRAKKIIKGGSGYCIENIDGKEYYNKSKDIQLPYDVEHIYPDYSIYFNDNDLLYDEDTGECLGLHPREKQKRETAYGYLTRGCPRGCDFCHVEAKEGRKSYKCADLSEFWNGQKYIVLLDPNITACREWRNLFQQLIDSGAYVDFSQGLDIRLMTAEKAQMIKQMKVKRLHFAWDRYEDKKTIVPKFEEFKEISGLDYRKLGVFVLCGFNTSIEQDLERIYTLRDVGYSPYVMLYKKDSLPKGHLLRKLQRYVNNRIIFRTVDSFEDYMKGQRR